MDIQEEADYSQLGNDFNETLVPLLKQYPASLKYHQCEKGGLATHTSLVANFSYKLFSFLPNTVKKYNAEKYAHPPIELNKIDFTQDELFVAALFHDTGKLYEYVANDNDVRTFRWRTDYDVSFGSALLSEIWEKVDKPPRWDKINNSWVNRPLHEILSNEVAKFFFERNDLPWNAKVENAILCHSGGWSKVPVKPQPIAMMLHCADLLGSQF